jgi:hypothetical protein
MKTKIATARRKPTSRAATGLLLLSMASMTLTSWTGCKGPRVIESHNTVTPLQQGQAFTPPYDGWFMSDSLYLRYRKAVADKIQEEQSR